MFLSEIGSAKNKLRKVNTIVTNVEGKRYVESKNGMVQIPSDKYGFVIDTKPDDVPAMIIEYFYIGSQDCVASSILKEHKITHILSLGVNPGIPDNIENLFVEFLDLPETDVKPVLKLCLPYIHKAIESNENILVHCNAGVSRTATVAIAYLMVYKGMDFEAAYKLVKEKRPAIQPNNGFTKQLKTLNMDVSKFSVE